MLGILLYYRDILGNSSWLAYYSLVSYLDDIICCVNFIFVYVIIIADIRIGVLKSCK